jgi:Zn-dependent oligopeptidase
MNISGRFLLLRTKKTTSLPLQRSSCVSKFKHHSLVSSMAASTAAAAEKRATLYSLNFQLAADGIDSTAKKIMDNHRQGMDSIVQMSSTKFEDSFRAFALCEAKAVISSSQVTLPALTSTDSAAREASSKAKQSLREMFSHAYSREDLYSVLKASYDSNSGRTSELSNEDVRLMDKTIKAFQLNGVGVEAGDQGSGSVKALKEECGKATATYEQNINEDTSVALLSKHDMVGCAETLFESLEASGNADDGDIFKVSMKAPIRIPVMQYAKNAKTRKKVKEVADSRCLKENSALLREILDLRMNRAKMLGYETHADYVLKQKMVGSLPAAREFLMDIHTKLAPLREADFAALKGVKQADDLAEEKSVLHSWDISYYSRILKEQSLQLDSEKIRKFFPLEHVKSSIFEIYQDLLSVKFVKLEQGTNVCWHDEVELYEVRDVESSEICGHFFLDLFSRDGKFGHQCVVPIVPSCCDFQKGTTVPPACAILGNMTKPTKTKPSLLRFPEVHTFFHEFGHVMHAVLSKCDYTRFSWTWPMMPWPGGVEQDFLEVPSMFLEKLVYEPDIIAKLSKHYETGEVLDSGTIERLNKAQHFLAGLKWSRFIAMAMFDLEIHSQTPPYTFGEQSNLSVEQLWSVMMSELGQQDEVEGTFMPSSWYHLVIGYDAGYYGYLYSEVFAYSILETILQHKNANESNGLSSIGKEYRKHILQPCATIDGMDMLKNFLKKSPTNSAFCSALGLSKT